MFSHAKIHMGTTGQLSPGMALQIPATGHGAEKGTSLPAAG
ncbi:hypothetical protein [Rhodococcus koreensis]|nr:hypothetical protein [Rhodococcus koreensis]